MRQCVISHNQCRSHRAKALAEALERGTTSNVVAGHPAMGFGTLRELSGTVRAEPFSEKASNS